MKDVIPYKEEVQFGLTIRKISHSNIIFGVVDKERKK